MRRSRSVYAERNCSEVKRIAWRPRMSSQADPSLISGHAPCNSRPQILPLYGCSPSTGSAEIALTPGRITKCGQCR
jgi:hypothetical protein